MSTNGEPHEHRWRLFKEDYGRAYDPMEVGGDLTQDQEGNLGWGVETFESLPYRPVTIRVFACEVCREVVVDKEYGELLVPASRPPRMRKLGMFERWWPKSLRPW